MVLAPDTQAPTLAPPRSRLASALWPLNNGGASDIRALDGLRAVAALSVIWMHAYLTLKVLPSIAGHQVAYIWTYGQTGVHLFFVLSGFLLFMPYARALLQARPLPSARRFYQRRALRILPAYWVCLAILLLLSLASYRSLTGLEDGVAHLLLIHDDFYNFNRAIEGPFWTLAVEVQFYLLLPLMAAGIGLLVGKSRSLARVAGGVLSVMALALLLRSLDAYGQGHLSHLAGGASVIVGVLLRVTMGAQGKYLEVFAVGMLASTLYVAASEGRWLAPRARRGLGMGLFMVGLVSVVWLAREVVGKGWAVPPFDLVTQPTSLVAICGPWLIGLSYGAIVLGALWGPPALRAPFESRPLRFIGLISYSLYLWHLPIIFGLAPLTTRLPGLLPLPAALAVGVFVAIPVAYVSYQLVERPFLRRRHRLAERAAPSVVTAASTVSA